MEHLKTILIVVMLTACYLHGKRQIRCYLYYLMLKKAVHPTRQKFLLTAFGTLLFLVYATTLLLTLDIGLVDLSVFLSSMFAMLGVALFAQWSILSNLSSSILIFFFFPYRIGDHIRIGDKDFDASGIITDITAFHVILKSDCGQAMIYPNSLLLQKGVAHTTLPAIKESQL